MKTIPLTIIMSLCVFAAPAFAQSESRKFDSVDVNATPCDDVKSRLDFAYGELLNNPTAKLHIIFYGGKKYWNQFWNVKRWDYYGKYLAPKRGEPKARVSFWKPYLMNTRRVEDSKIEVIDGGYRIKPEVEMWLVPFGAKPPEPTPTLRERDIRFRKGKPKWSDMFGEGCG